jgi:hypothetical protein
MSDWSSYAAQRVKRQRENNNLKDARMSHDERLLAEYAPGRWEELRRIFLEMCSQFNAEPEMRDTLAYDNSNPNALKIENTQTKMVLRVTFDPEHYEIKIGGLGGPSATAAYYKIAVVPGQRETHFIEGSNSVAAHEIARKALDSLLGI